MLSDDDVNLEDLKNQLPDGIIPDVLKNVTVPTADDAKQIFKEKCIKVSGSDAAFQEAEVNLRDSKCDTKHNSFLIIFLASFNTTNGMRH